MPTGDRCISLAEHLARRPEQEVHQVPKKPGHRLIGSELPMSRRPTTTAMAEAHIKWWQQTCFSQEPMGADADPAMEPTDATWAPELDLKLRFDDADTQGVDVVQPSSSPIQASEPKPSTSSGLENSLHLGLKPDGLSRQKSSEVWAGQQHHLVPPSIFNLSTFSAKDPMVAASCVDNSNQPGSCLSRILTEKRQNPVSVSDLGSKARPQSNLATTSEIFQELPLVESQAFPPHTRAQKHHNRVLISELALKPRPHDPSILPSSHPVVSDPVIPASAAGMTTRKRNNRILASDLSLKPRPSQYGIEATTGALMGSYLYGPRVVLAEGAVAVVPSPSTASLAATPGTPAPASNRSTDNFPPQALPAPTSTVQDVAFHPDQFFSASDKASSPAPSLVLPFIESTPVDLYIPAIATATAPTFDMVPPKNWGRNNNASYAKAASAQANTSIKATASKAALDNAGLIDSTSAMVPPFNRGTSNATASVTKTPSIPVPNTAEALSSAKSKLYTTTLSGSEMAPATFTAAAPRSNDKAVAPAADKTDDAASNSSRAVTKTYVLLATFGYKQADTHDPELRAILVAIEKRHSVTIHIDGVKNRLIVYSPNKQKAAETIQSLRKDLWLEQGSSNVWSPSLFLGPPKSRLKDFKATFDIEESPSGGRPTAQGNAPAALPHETNQLRARWMSDFRDTMFKAVKAMRVRPVQMGMRVHLGKVRLQERQKNKTTYTFHELQAWIARHCSRHGFKFDKLLGADGFGYRILQEICMSDSFSALDSRVFRVHDVKPKHTLILQTINLRIETDIISIYDGFRETLRLGPARGYRREQRKEVMEIGTIFPEKMFDWNLSVETRVPVASLPFTHEDISSNAMITTNEDPDGFPRILLHEHFAQTQQVEDIKGKTSWSYKLKSTDFVVEVAIHHLLRANTSKSVQSGTGIDMHYSAWDDELDAHNLATGPRSWTEENFEELFPTSGDKDGISAFLSHVTEVQDLISRMAAEDSPGKPVSEGPDVSEGDLMTFEDELRKIAEEYTIKKEPGSTTTTEGVSQLNIQPKQEEDDHVTKFRPAFNTDDLLIFEEQLGATDAYKQENEKKVVSKGEPGEELDLISFD